MKNSDQAMKARKRKKKTLKPRWMRRGMATRKLRKRGYPRSKEAEREM
jgi:hypothetical protein